MFVPFIQKRNYITPTSNQGGVDLPDCPKERNYITPTWIDLPGCPKVCAPTASQCQRLSHNVCSPIQERISFTPASYHRRPSPYSPDGSSYRQKIPFPQYQYNYAYDIPPTLSSWLPASADDSNSSDASTSPSEIEKKPQGRPRLKKQLLRRPTRRIVKPHHSKANGAPPLPRPKRTPTIDSVTQVMVLTNEIVLSPPDPVSHGGFSDIYKGEWEYTERLEGLAKIQVAVKLLRGLTRGMVDLERSQKRLNREVNILKRLNHPNIARFYGTSFQLGGRPALVMQWYDNGTASNFVKNCSAEYKLELVAEVACGLKYLHSLDPPVVHGDLKGNNILVDDNGHAVLSDFGLSKVMDSLNIRTGNTTTTLAGSVRWQAPELLFDNEDEDDSEELEWFTLTMPSLSSDVWSFGCTAYELLTGHFPYHHRLHDWRAVQDIMQGNGPLRPNDVIIHDSKPLLDILKECWSLRPQDRPNMGQVESRLNDVVL